MSQKKIDVLQYNAIFAQEEDGGYSVWVPSLPGCASQGDSFQEAMKNIEEAIALYLQKSPEVVEMGDESSEKQFLVPVKISYA